MNAQEQALTDIQVGDVYGGSRLKAADIPPGKRFNLVIESVALENMPERDGKAGKRRLVVSFAGAAKSLVLNVTNAGILSDALGPRPAAWPGAHMVLERQTTQYQGQSVPALRITKAVRTAEPRQQTLKAIAESDAHDDANFVPNEDDLAFLND